MSARAGSSLVELIVALTVFTVGLLGLAGAAALAQRSFNRAALLEHGTVLAAAVLDSLLRVPDPAAGAVRSGPVSVTWTVASDSTMRTVRLEASAADEPTVMLEVAHSERAR